MKNMNKMRKKPHVVFLKYFIVILHLILDNVA